MSLKKLTNKGEKPIKVSLPIGEGLLLVERTVNEFECILLGTNISAKEDYFNDLASIKGFRYIGSEKLYKKLETEKYNWFERELRTVFLQQKQSIFYYPSKGTVRIPKPNESDAQVVKSRRTASSKKQVLIIDDSATIQKLLKKIISESEILEVMGTASCPSEAREIIEKETPDLITLDIHMPEMTGVEFLKTYLVRYNIPVVMISSVSISEGPLVMDALSNGAQSYIQKPSLQDVNEISKEILLKLENLAEIDLKKMSSSSGSEVASDGYFKDLNGLVVIGASTGGTQTLETILTHLPNDIPPIVIVQHIPAVFSKALADRLNGICPFRVKEAEDGEYVEKNNVYIAPGGFQCSLKNGQGRYRVAITDDEPLNRFKPSVDFLFNSVAKLPIKNRVGVILTGMGNDGAEGMLKLLHSGVKTIAQDEASCVVFGMPKEAIKLGAAENIVNLSDMPREISSIYNKKKALVA